MTKEEEEGFFAGKEPPPPPIRVAKTTEVIAQAGVAEVRSPKRIARYVAGGAVVVVLALVALSRLGVGPFVLSSPDSEDGKVFTGASDDTTFLSKLLGKRQRPHAAVAPAHLAPTAEDHRQEHPSAQEPLVHKEKQHVEALAENDKETLARLYAQQSLSAPTAAPTAALDRADARPDAQLTPDQVAKTIGAYQSGYVSCINRELQRNPGFPGGKIRIVTTVMSSGVVGGARIESDNPQIARTVAQSSLGTCLVAQTRRIIFPSFAGRPFDVEIPLVLAAN